MTPAVPAARLPDALLDPSVYGPGVGSVELCETHISWVFLAGDRAYKVKKPVALPFVDYSDPLRRRAYCEEEVRLNRRLAPDVYRGVVAFVPRADGRLALAGADARDASEHAVEMRRYDERATLAAALADGRAGAEQVAAVGARIARFHAHADRAADGARALEGLEGVVAETLDTLGTAAAAAGDAPDPARLTAVGRFCRSALSVLAGELRARAAAGHVRDGHGDLRAEHVLLTEPLAIVDALEFDPALRTTDTAYDLAFLVMDLARTDARLAEALLDGYRAAGGDPGSGRLIAFLAALRALVRAKVELLRAAQLSGPDAAERRERALGLVALAERLAWRVRLPPVACVAGLSGSGKSTVAEALAAASGRAVLRSDVVRKRRAGLAPHTRADVEAYAPETGPAVYRELGEQAAASAAGPGVIVDATFRRAADVAAFTAACAAPLGFVECRAPADVLLERARRRGGVPEHGSDAGPDVVRAQLEETGGTLPLPDPPLAVLDTTGPTADMLERLAAELDGTAGETVPARRRRRRADGPQV